MSKIYKRPMFRGGGKVSSYGNGIATGLTSKPKRGLVDEPGGYAGETFGGSYNVVPQSQYTGGANQGGNILSRNLSKFKNFSLPKGKNIEARLGKGVKSLFNFLPKKGLIETVPKFAMKNFPKITKGTGITGALSGPSMVAEISRPQTYEALQFMKDTSKNNAGVFDETAFDDFTEYDSQFQKLNDPTKYSAMPDNRGFFNKLLNPFSGFTGLREKSDAEIAQIVDNKKSETEAKEKDAAAAATGKDITVDINTGEPVESRKDRLKRTAKEYQEILGDGIKKDSIFDAMVAGGTSLMAGEGYASAIRQANKELDPIQNIKTASNKLALEEDIAMRKAIALDKTKRTATSDIIALGKSSGKSDAEIYKDVIKNKSKSKAEIITGYKDAFGTGPGFKEYVMDTYGKNIKFFDVDIEKVDFETVEDGVYYQPPTGKADKYKDKFVTVKDNKVVKVTPRNK